MGENTSDYSSLVYYRTYPLTPKRMVTGESLTFLLGIYIPTSREEKSSKIELLISQPYCLARSNTEIGITMPSCLVNTSV